MAQVDTRIPFMAFPKQNILESYYSGKRMQQESALGAQKVQGGENALAAETARTLARGVLNSPNPEMDYPRALQQAQSMGMDVSPFPKTYDENAQMMLRMLAKPEGELSTLEMRAKNSGLAPGSDEYKQFFLTGGKPQGNDAVWRQKMSQMVKMGMPPHIASGIATGRYKLTVDEVNGTRVVTDMATGKPVDYGQSAGSATPAAAGPASPASVEPGFFDTAGQTAGAWSGAQQLSTDILGQLPFIGDWFTAPDTVRARQEVTAATGELVRALSVNSKNPVAYMKQIRDEVGIAPSIWESEEGLQSRMEGIDAYLRKILKNEKIVSADDSMPAQRRKDALTKAQAIESFLGLLGVPQGIGKSKPGGMINLRDEQPWGEDIETRLQAYD